MTTLTTTVRSTVAVNRTLIASATFIVFGLADILLFGRESAGVPDNVHAVADARILIPMPGGGRSLNVALAAAMTVGEALRQVSLRGRDHIGAL